MNLSQMLQQKLVPAPPREVSRQEGFDWRTTRTVRMVILPDTASQWLKERNSHNRPLKESHWMKLAVDMLEGNWMYNGDSIRFSSDGVLLDGQHRLMACVEAKVPLETNVTFGLDSASMATIDHNRSRTAGDQLALDGVPNSNQAAAIAALIIIHRKHGIQRMSHATLTPTKMQVNAECMQDWRGTQAIQQAIHASTAIGTKLGVANRFIGFCYYEFARQNKTLADKFFQQLESGLDLSKDDPVYHLRERLASNKGAKARLNSMEVLALIIKAWAAFRDGRSVRNLRWRSDGPTPEPFPQI